ncbi:MAG: hypothetical protein QW076_02690, partial [Candidatus Anstonellales archaeon]
EANADYDLIYTDAEIIKANGDRTGKRYSNIFNIRKRINSGYIYNDLKKSNFIVFSSVMIRRDILREFKGFDDKLSVCIDWWFFIELSRTHKFYYLDQVLTYIRIHGGNDSLHNIDRFYMDYVEIYGRLLAKHPNDNELLFRKCFNLILLGHSKTAHDEILQSSLLFRDVRLTFLFLFTLPFFDKMLRLIIDFRLWLIHRFVYS